MISRAGEPEPKALDQVDGSQVKDSRGKRQCDKLRNVALPGFASGRESEDGSQAERQPARPSVGSSVDAAEGFCIYLSRSPGAWQSVIVPAHVARQDPLVR